MMYDRDDETTWAKERRDDVILHLVRVDADEDKILHTMCILGTGLEVDWPDDIGECSTAGRGDSFFAATREICSCVPLVPYIYNVNPKSSRLTRRMWCVSAAKT